MGICLSWAAVRGKPVPLVLALLGYAPTGTREPLFWSSSNEVPYIGGDFNGWYFLFNPGNDLMSSPALAKPLSTGCEVVVCFVESHVMVSSAGGFRNGKRIWSVLHDSLDRGPGHLEATGELPPAWPEIRRTALGRQEPGVDYVFNAPVDLAENVTGFRHDRVLEADFDVLERVSQAGS